MRKLFAITLVLVFSLQLGLAQKIAYVNTEEIMSQIDEYNSIQSEIDRISQSWQKELEDKYQEIEKLYKDFVANEVLWPKDVKDQKQEEIFQKEREAKEFREKKFGYNGELFQLQENRVKPLQDRVFRAVETVAKKKRFDFVFDKAGEVTWLYTNATYDLTQDVLEEMGVNKQ